MFLLVLTITALIGLGLVFSYANADKDKLNLGAGVSGQVGVGIGKSSGGENETVSATSQTGANASVSNRGSSQSSSQVGANVASSSQVSSQSSEQNSQEYNGNEQGTMEEESHGHFKSSYEKIYADSDNSFTIQTSRHLYKPGDQVEIDGTIWSGLMANVGNISTVSIEVQDNGGNVVYNGTSQVNSGGQYSATFQLPSDAKNGAYDVNVKANVSADILSTVSAKIQASLSQDGKFVVVSPNAWAVKAEGKDFGVNIATNSSSVNNFNFDEQHKKLSFTVQGETGTKGVLDIDIPKPLLSGNMTVMMDGQVMSQSDIIETDAQDHTTLEINYHHSTHQIDIIGTNAVPEFPLAIPVFLASIVSLIAFYRMGFGK